MGSRRGNDGEDLSLAPQMIVLPIFSLRLQPMPLVRCLYDALSTVPRALFAEIVSKTMIVALSMPPHA